MAVLEHELEHTVVEGRDATVAYLNKSFELVEASQAEIVKIVFDDTGEILFLVPKKEKSS